MRVRDLNQAAQKFSTNGAAGSNNYKLGVQANNTWAQNTEAAAPTWQQGVTAPGAADRYKNRVAKAGQGKWQSRAAGVGQQRFQTAMSDANTRSNWQNAFQPFATVLASIPVPPKGVRGSPSNYQIVQTIGDALHKAKLGQ